MKIKSAVVVCPSVSSLRATELIVRSLGYGTKKDSTPVFSSAARGFNPSPSGRYLLYLEGEAKYLSWDHDVRNILSKAITDGYVRIDSSDQLFAYLDTPPLAPKPVVTIPLNIEYSAKVSDTDVKVGCQTFPHAAILQVADEIIRRSAKDLTGCCLTSAKKAF